MMSSCCNWWFSSWKAFSFVLECLMSSCSILHNLWHWPSSLICISLVFDSCPEHSGDIISYSWMLWSIILDIMKSSKKKRRSLCFEYQFDWNWILRSSHNKTSLPKIPTMSHLKTLESSYVFLTFEKEYMYLKASSLYHLMQRYIWFDDWRFYVTFL